MMLVNESAALVSNRMVTRKQARRDRHGDGAAGGGRGAAQGLWPYFRLAGRLAGGRC